MLCTAQYGGGVSWTRTMGARTADGTIAAPQITLWSVLVKKKSPQNTFRDRAMGADTVVLRTVFFQSDNRSGNRGVPMADSRFHDQRLSPWTGPQWHSPLLQCGYIPANYYLERSVNVTNDASLSPRSTDLFDRHGPHTNYCSRHRTVKRIFRC